MNILLVAKCQLHGRLLRAETASLVVRLTDHIQEIGTGRIVRAGRVYNYILPNNPQVLTCLDVSDPGPAALYVYERHSDIYEQGPACVHTVMNLVLRWILRMLYARKLILRGPAMPVSFVFLYNSRCRSYSIVRHEYRVVTSALILRL